MVVKVDKCLMHRLGFKLEDLAINGLNPSGCEFLLLSISKREFSPLQPSGLNTCVGKLDYETGTDYKFTLYGEDACGMQKTTNGTHDVLTNSLSGSIFKGQNGSLETVEVHSEFSCIFDGKFIVGDPVVLVEQIQTAIRYNKSILFISQN